MLKYTLLMLLLVSMGCIDPSKMNSGDEAAENADAPAQVDAPANGGEAAPVAPQGFAQVEWKLVDKKKALAENPKLIEVVNKTNASDPWSAAAQSYFTIGSKAHMLAFKHSVDLHKAQYDKNPTFEEFDKMMKSSHVDLKGLYPWQVYAYDDSDGSMVILENAEEKARRYEEAGISE